MVLSPDTAVLVNPTAVPVRDNAVLVELIAVDVPSAFAVLVRLGVGDGPGVAVRIIGVAVAGGEVGGTYTGMGVRLGVRLGTAVNAGVKVGRGVLVEGIPVGAGVLVGTGVVVLVGVGDMLGVGVTDGSGVGGTPVYVIFTQSIYKY